MPDKKREEEERRRKKKEEERRKQLSRSRQNQELIFKRRYRTIHDRNRRRRKRDCALGMPFILAFQGDPARPFYCNDVRDGREPIYELIKSENGTLSRLRRYMLHHVVQMQAKVLIYKAA